MPRGKDRETLKKIGEKTRFKSGVQQAETARQGGIASQKAQRAKRNIKQAVLAILEMDAPLSQQQQVLETFGIEDATNSDMIALGLVRNAEKGNIAAYEKIQQYQEESEIKENKLYELPARVLGKAFSDINREIVPNKKYVFKGGRGSLKSSFIGFKCIEILKNNPMMHMVAVRQVKDTIKDSIYAQLKWCINELGLNDEFEIKKSPLEIVYKETGQNIYFRGCDDPTRIKSIKPPFGYIGILWKEEKDQLKGANAERNINQSAMRGEGDAFYDFSSYNPPKSKDNWVNKELEIPDENRVVHESNYKDAPKQWLGPMFIQEAEHLKNVNPEAYENEYEGVANGAGGNIFDNVITREITDEEISHFDTIYQGIDWGDAPDPSVFLRLYYDADSETIYFIDEMCENHKSNTAIADWIKERNYDDFEIICDSSEKRSIADLRDLGLRAKAAKKGPGSVEYGIKWLQKRKLVIDPRRTPRTHKEFTEYAFERDKEGNIITGYPDKDNHTIDTTRYALERYANKRGNQA